MASRKYYGFYFSFERIGKILKKKKMATKLALGKSKKQFGAKAKNTKSIHNKQKCSLTIIIKFSARKNDRKKL